MRLLKAGDTVSDTFCTKRVFFSLNTVFQIVCQTLFVAKTASETLFAPPLMKPGYGARYIVGEIPADYTLCWAYDAKPVTESVKALAVTF